MSCCFFGDFFAIVSFNLCSTEFLIFSKKYLNKNVLFYVVRSHAFDDVPCFSICITAKKLYFSIYLIKGPTQPQHNLRFVKINPDTCLIQGGFLGGGFNTKEGFLGVQHQNIHD